MESSPDVVTTHSRRPSRILYRIIVPFTILFAVTTIFSWLFSAYFITHYMRKNLEEQIKQVAEVVSSSPYVLNPVILHELKLLIKSEIVVFDAEGQILISTFTSPATPSVSQELLRSISDTTGDIFQRDVDCGDKRYLLVLHPVASRDHDNTVISVWMPVDETNNLMETLIIGMGFIALIGVLAMAAVAYFITRTITAPLEELVEVTESVASGNFSHRAGIRTQDEIGGLAFSFNQMIEKLESYRLRLVESEKLATAGQMAAGLAHEIRNPLTSIKMLGQVLRGRLKDQDQNQQMLDSMVQEINRLDRIIQEMIDRTKPGELQLEWEELNQQVQEVAELVKENLAARDIFLEYHLSSVLPTIYMDREKVKQVLWNLILNARDAMPKGGRLEVSTRSDEDGTVEVTVDDSGQGLCNGDAERLFQPFYTTKPEGMGLGLAISRKIVEKHGGSLILENRPDGGARARVILPVRR